VDVEIALEELGKKIKKQYDAGMRSFKNWRNKCPHQTSRSYRDSVAGCKHEDAYAKHPNLTLAWCDYNCCPIIAKGMKI